MRVTLIFSGLVAVIGLSVSLLLAVMADRVLRGATVYKTLLIWPYAVAPAVARDPVALPVQSHARHRRALARQGSALPWNPLLDANDGADMVVIAAVWKQISYNFLFFLAGLQSIPRSLIEAAAIDGAGPVRRFCDDRVPLLSPTTFFLLVVNIVYAFFDTFGIIDAATSGGPRTRDRDPRLQGVRRRLQGPRPRRLGRAVGRADGDRRRAHVRAVPLRRAQGPILIPAR
jgi:sn-glycerol 3-phosphate transport system permease protein